jgi:hypothetical protein
MKKVYAFETQIRTASNGVPILDGCSHAQLASRRYDRDVPSEYPVRVLTAYHMVNGDLRGESCGYVYFSHSIGQSKKNENGEYTYFDYSKWKILRHEAGICILDPDVIPLKSWKDFPEIPDEEVE